MTYEQAIEAMLQRLAPYFGPTVDEEDARAIIVHAVEAIGLRKMMERPLKDRRTAPRTGP